MAKLSKLHTEVAKIEDSLYDGNYSKIDNYIVLKKDLTQELGFKILKKLLLIIVHYLHYLLFFIISLFYFIL